MKSDDVRTIIRQKLADGRLPYDRIPSLWGGQGKNEPCLACELPIKTSEFVMEDTGDATQRDQFHVQCVNVWDFERTAPRG